MIPLKEQAQKSIELRRDSITDFRRSMQEVVPGQTLSKQIALEGIMRDRGLAVATYYAWVRNSDNVSFADLSPDKS